MKKYIANCFLLIIPILLWNVLLVDYLPRSYSDEVFSKNIPTAVEYAENIFRVLALGLPFFMGFALKNRIQKIGFSLYLIGTIIYFMSWLILMLYPGSIWALSIFGFMAPAYTPIIWLVGIGLIGQEHFIKIPFFKAIYFSAISLFVVIHSYHAYIVFETL